MQPLQNNDLHRFPSERGKGIAGTVLIHAVALILMVLLGFSLSPPPETEQGILVNFGTDETGAGLIEPSAPSALEESAPSVSDAKLTTEDEPLLTQNTEEAPVVKKVDPEAERRRLEQIETEKVRRAEIEAERIRKTEEEAKRKIIEAAQQRQQEIIDKTKNALAASRNSGTNSTGEGITGGTGNQGVTTGSVESQNRGNGSGLGNSGISYELAGRGQQKLPDPKYDYQDEGKVVVEVSVDRSGKVIQATPGIKGSSTLDEYLLRVSKEAALAAQFEPKADAPSVQKGTITYNFKLK